MLIESEMLASVHAAVWNQAKEAYLLALHIIDSYTNVLWWK